MGKKIIGDDSTRRIHPQANQSYFCLCINMRNDIRVMRPGTNSRVNHTLYNLRNLYRYRQMPGPGAISLTTQVIYRSSSFTGAIYIQAIYLSSILFLMQDRNNTKYNRKDFSMQ